MGFLSKILLLIASLVGTRLIVPVHNKENLLYDPPASKYTMSTNSTQSFTTTRTEHKILTSFLLSRAPLTDILPLTHFIALFPAKRRQNTQIKLLYRHLQAQRTSVLDRVEKNIEFEVLQGKRQRKRVLQSLRSQKNNTNGENISAETMAGVELFGTANYEPIIPLKELLAMMEDAVEEVAAEERRLEAECDALLGEMQGWVGDMSDLIYGKFGVQGIESKVMEQLENLTETCERVLEDSN